LDRDLDRSAPRGPGLDEGGLRIRRRCPACGAPVRHAEADGAVVCPFCGVGLAVVGGTDRLDRYAMLPRARPEGVGVRAEANRALRAAGRRVLDLGTPRLFYAPFYRLRALVWECWREPAAAAAGEDLPRATGDARGPRAWLLSADLLRTAQERRPPPAPAGPRSSGFRVAVRDVSLAATTSPDLGRSNVGFRTQTCEIVPWPEAEAGQAIEGDVEETEARRRLVALLDAASSPPPEVREHCVLAPERRFLLLYAPYLLFPARGPEGPLAVVVDAITGRAGPVLHGAEPARLEARLAPAPATTATPDGADADTAGGTADAIPGDAALLPLLCPECGHPLPCAPRAQVHACPLCGRAWQAAAAGFVPVPVRALHARRTAGTGVGAGAGAGGNDGAAAKWLPFYRVPHTKRDAYVPAFLGRHPRAAWLFAFALSRRPRTWDESEDPVVPETPVELRAEAAAALLPLFPFHLRETAERPAGPAELVWIAFVPRGPDLVEPGSGLGLPRAALSPWAPSRSPERRGSGGARTPARRAPAPPEGSTGPSS